MGLVWSGTGRCTYAAMIFAVVLAIPLTSTTADGGSYGPGLSADALCNTRIGGPWLSTASYGFRSTHTGRLAAIQLYVIWSATSSGYNGGTGGSLLVRIQTDDGTAAHHPSGQTIASYLHTDPMSKGNFPVLTFAAPPSLTAGTLYHVVITNPDPDPGTNYVSVNSLWMRKGATPRQPRFADADWFQLMGFSNEPNVWTSPALNGPDSYTPILVLRFADGYTTGVGYMEVWTESTKPIAGTASVRETFTVSGADRSVTGVSIRLRRVSGTAPLTVRLEQGNGTLIESMSIGGIDTTFGWVEHAFSSVRTLTKGARYALTLQAPAGTVYEAYPLREGSSSNVRFSAASYFTDGFAQFTTNGSWTGWDQWGGAERLDGDLQFLFSTVEGAPVAPDPVVPGSATVLTSGSVVLRWHASSGAISYRAQVSPDSLFASTLKDSTVIDTVMTFVPPAGTGPWYFARVCAQDGSGSSAYSAPFRFSATVPKSDVVGGSGHATTPLSIINYPNPFNPSTTVQYYLNAALEISLEVYDVLGRMVARLADGPKAAGTYSVVWDASAHAAGVYLCVLRAGPSRAVSRLELLR